MKKIQFLLLDAGPIIKLFELGVWDAFIKNCDVTVCRIVANEAKYASQEYEDIRMRSRVLLISRMLIFLWSKISMTD